LNRLLLFGLGPLLRNRHVIAWSAGAMALGDRIVLFHDRLPEGRRDPELLGDGLGLVSAYVLLPDGAHRLRKQDTVRLRVFCQRFAPRTCAMLDRGSLLVLDDDRLIAADSVSRIKANGAVGVVRAR